jgi:hypothetical protein
VELTMDPWDWRHTTVSSDSGAVIVHLVELRTEQAWVDIKAANGTVTRVFGDGTVVVQSY